LTDVGGHGSPGAFKAETTFQFIGQQGEIEWLTVGQDLGQKLGGLGRPIGVVIATGRLGLKMLLVTEPVVTQFIEAGLFDHQPFGGGIGIQQAAVKGREDFLDKECGSAAS